MIIIISFIRTSADCVIYQSFPFESSQQQHSLWTREFTMHRPTVQLLLMLKQVSLLEEMEPLNTIVLNNVKQSKAAALLQYHPPPLCFVSHCDLLINMCQSTTQQPANSWSWWCHHPPPTLYLVAKLVRLLFHYVILHFVKLAIHHHHQRWMVVVGEEKKWISSRGYYYYCCCSFDNFQNSFVANCLPFLLNLRAVQPFPLHVARYYELTYQSTAIACCRLLVT